MRTVTLVGVRCNTFIKVTLTDLQLKQILGTRMYREITLEEINGALELKQCIAERDALTRHLIHSTFDGVSIPHDFGVIPGLGQSSPGLITSTRTRPNFALRPDQISVSVNGIHLCGDKTIYKTELFVSPFGGHGRAVPKLKFEDHFNLKESIALELLGRRPFVPYRFGDGYRLLPNLKGRTTAELVAKSTLVDPVTRDSLLNFLDQTLPLTTGKGHVDVLARVLTRLENPAHQSALFVTGGAFSARELKYFSKLTAHKWAEDVACQSRGFW